MGQVKFVGGVNRPKLVECLDSQGKTHRQLVKSGHDDLRQDAVMQQFFRLLNSFLQSRPSSRRRRLHIATYKAGYCPSLFCLFKSCKKHMLYQQEGKLLPSSSCLSQPCTMHMLYRCFLGVRHALLELEGWSSSVTCPAGKFVGDSSPS